MDRVVSWTLQKLTGGLWDHSNQFLPDNLQEAHKNRISNTFTLVLEKRSDNEWAISIGDKDDSGYMAILTSEQASKLAKEMAREDLWVDLWNA